MFIIFTKYSWVINDYYDPYKRIIIIKIWLIYDIQYGDESRFDDCIAIVNYTIKYI